MDQSEVIDNVKQFIRNLQEDGIIIKFALLFGSFARNEASPNSDIDVLLVSDMFDTEHKLFFKNQCIHKSENIYRIKPVSDDQKRIETDDVSPIILIAREEGIKITA